MPAVESYAIGPTEPPVRDITMGQLLEEAVADASVVGLPDERFGEIVGAFIRDADPDNPASDAELQDYCREHISPQKTPKVWRRVDAFPLTGSGKVQKFVLREQWEKEPK